MKIFISHRSIDTEEVDILLSKMSGLDFVSHRTLEATDDIWKAKVTSLMEQSDVVLFFLGATSKESKPVNWEYDLAQNLGIKRFAVKLSTSVVPDYCKKEVFIDNHPRTIESKLRNLQLITTDDILLEQYRLMVSSTELVTKQRLKVNNLFFTVTTSLLSISAIAGKLIGFEDTRTSLLAVGVMLFFTIVAFIISFFWQKLVNSYGLLNKGKFALIGEIEDQLNTNLFQREWEILQGDIGYTSNTKTESNIIIWFRVFIIIIGLIELVYLGNLCFGWFLS